MNEGDWIPDDLIVPPVRKFAFLSPCDSETWAWILRVRWSRFNAPTNFTSVCYVDVWTLTCSATRDFLPSETTFGFDTSVSITNELPAKFNLRSKYTIVPYSWQETTANDHQDESLKQYSLSTRNRSLCAKDTLIAKISGWLM